MQDDFLGNPPSIARTFILSKYLLNTHPETRVKYTAASGITPREQTFDIEGELTKSSIPNKSNVEKVDIGNTVTSIGDSEFYNCSGLTSVSIPNSVTSIGEQAFAYCTALTNVTIAIGNGVTSIGYGVFQSCTGLTSVTIGNGVTSIEQGAFQYCTGLTRMDFPGKSTTTVRNMIVNDYILGTSLAANQTIRMVCSNGSLDVSYEDNAFKIVVNGNGCLLKGTQVTLANGTEKPIEDITYDDELLVWDFDNGCLSTAKPAWIKKAQQTDYYFVNTYESGNKLFTTGQSETGWGHRTFDIDKGRFIYTTESVSDTIYTLDGPDRHMSCVRMNEPCEYYNIITEGHFNLFANRVLTSCSLNNLYPVSNMKFEKDGRETRKLSDFANVPEKLFASLRLAENAGDIEKLNVYVANLVKNAI